MKAIIDQILNHSCFEIITHVWPDEDAVGSSTALSLGLTALGKQVCRRYPSAVPEALTLSEISEPHTDFAPEISLLVDVSDPGMLGDITPAGTIVIVDHHKTATQYGQIRWIDPTKSSASEMVYELLTALDIPLDERMASNLYMGIFGDTGGFSHANTTLAVFQIATELVSRGAPPHQIANRLKRNKPLNWYRLLCLAIDRLHIVQGVYASYLTQDDFKTLGAKSQEASGIVQEIASLAGGELSIFLRDSDNETVHCSMRSRTTPAARLTAEAFGGGGHDRAAGFSRPGRAADLIEAVIAEGTRWT